MSRELVLQALEELYRKLRRPVKPIEVYEYLRQKGVPINDRRVREALSDLAEKRIARKVVLGGRVFYEPLERKQPQLPAITLERFVRGIGPPTTSEEVSAQMERFEGQLKKAVAFQIVERLKRAEILTERVRRFASRLAEKDPEKLALGLLKAACLKFYEYAKRGDARYKRLVDALRVVIERWYVSVLGVPALQFHRPRAMRLRELWLTGNVDENILCGNAEEILQSPIAAISYFFEEEVGGVGISFVAFSEKRLEMILRTRFTDDKLVVPTRIPQAEEVVYVVGQDTSYWPITFDPVFLLGKPGPSVDVYVLAGIRYGTWRIARGPRTAFAAEVVPNPRRLGELEEEDALQKGFIVTPEMVEEGEKRVVEAAMNTLEYTMMIEGLNPAAGDRGRSLVIRGGGERPDRSPRPVFHDGRLFPYEHKIDDYAKGYGPRHSELVRRSFRRFRELLRIVSGDPSVTVVGVVKRPHSPALHPLVVYGLYEERALEEDELWNLLPQWSYAERYEVASLLEGMFQERPPREGETYRTVGILRRFWATDLGIVEAFARPGSGSGASDQTDELDEEFWLEKVVLGLDQLVIPESESGCGRGVRGYLCLKGVRDPEAAETLAYVLARATVAMAYAFPPGMRHEAISSMRHERIALPRYEVLVPPPPKEAFLDPKTLEEYRKTVGRALSWIALPRIEDETGKLTDYDIAEMADEVGGRPLRFLTLIPHHIFMADMTVKEYDGQLREMYREDLLREIRRILGERASGRWGQ